MIESLSREEWITEESNTQEEVEFRSALSGAEVHDQQIIGTIPMLTSNISYVGAIAPTH